eukprot:sb/3469120/
MCITFCVSHSHVITLSPLRFANLLQRSTIYLSIYYLQSAWACQRQAHRGLSQSDIAGNAEIMIISVAFSLSLSLSLSVSLTLSLSLSLSLSLHPLSLSLHPVELSSGAPNFRVKRIIALCIHNARFPYHKWTRFKPGARTHDPEINPLEPDDAKTQPLFRALLWQNGDRYELTLFGARTSHAGSRSSSRRWYPGRDPGSRSQKFPPDHDPERAENGLLSDTLTMCTLHSTKSWRPTSF